MSKKIRIIADMVSSVPHNQALVELTESELLSQLPKNYICVGLNQPDPKPKEYCDDDCPFCEIEGVSIGDYVKIKNPDVQIRTMIVESIVKLNEVIREQKKIKERLR